jgi:hypothetical protein
MSYYHIYAQHLQSSDNREVLELVDDTIRLSTQDDVCYIVDFCWEGFDLRQWLPNYFQFISGLKKYKPKSRIFVLLNSHFQPVQEEFFSELVDDYLLLDYFLYRTYRELTKFKTSKISQCWNNKNDKFLCLGGRFKPLRLEFFKTLATQNLLDHALYSFHLGPIDAEIWPNVDWEFGKTLSQKASVTDYSGNGVYYNDIFDNCLFQLIVESSALTNSDIPWITEKTWISILNKNPFIVYGDVTLLSELKKMGLKTFEDYLEFPDYNNDTTLVRVEKLAANVSYWLKNIQKYQNQINNDVEFNYIKLQEIYKHNLTLIENFIKKNQINLDIDRVIPTDFTNLNKSWRIFYNNIKGTSWPDCIDFRDVEKLPNNIKQELFLCDYSFLKQWPQRLGEFESYKNNI